MLQLWYDQIDAHQITEITLVVFNWKQHRPSGLLPPKTMASMGTPSSLSHWGSMIGHWPAGAQKRELGWAHGVELPFGREEKNCLLYFQCFINIYIWIPGLILCLVTPLRHIKLHTTRWHCIHYGWIGCMALHLICWESRKVCDERESNIDFGVSLTKNICSVWYCKLFATVSINNQNWWGDVRKKKHDPR